MSGTELSVTLTLCSVFSKSLQKAYFHLLFSINAIQLAMFKPHKSNYSANAHVYQTFNRHVNEYLTIFFLSAVAPEM